MFAASKATLDHHEEPKVIMSTFEITKAVKLLYRPGDVVEIRALRPPDVPYVGRYTYGKNLVNAIDYLDREAMYDVYFVLNPTKLEPVVAQQYMRGTKKEDIAIRRWFLLDADPVRPHKISTDAEFFRAYAVMNQARDWLISRGWDKEGIVMASSGNGVHLLVRCDLPNTEESHRLVKITQNAVTRKFSNPEVLIECFPDSDRLVRAYGTLNKKGTQDESHKWRHSRITGDEIL